MNEFKWFSTCLYFICAFLVSAGVLATEEYVIGPEDVLEVSIYDHSELTSTVRVGGNGVVTLPLLDAIEVGGLTVSQVTKKITNLLSDGYIVNPKVNIFVRNFREQKAVILGQVNKPGLYEIRADASLLELLSLAGGLTLEAGDVATLKRMTDNGEEEHRIDLERLIERGDTSLNLILMDGDKVFVDKAGVFFVTGEVTRSSSYEYQDDLTLIKAIAMAGGFTKFAQQRHVRIVRQVDGQEKIIDEASMDTEVLPDDVIVVPKNKWFGKEFNP